MHILFCYRNRNLCSILTSHWKSSKFDLPISEIRIFSKALFPKSKFESLYSEAEVLYSSKPTHQTTQQWSKTEKSPIQREPTKVNEPRIQISHPWPEWIDFMEVLLKRGYLEGDGNPLRSGELSSKEVNVVRTACLNFARDRPGSIRFLSRKDIEVIAGCGCPSIDRKVVNSGKRLRAHVGIDEENICSSCNLRGHCERAYLKAYEHEEAQTVDVMRFLLTYGLHLISNTLENESCQNKLVREAVRKMLKELAAFGSQYDPQTSTAIERSACNHFSNRQEKNLTSVPMKRGDWICPKCNFLNFGKNIKCLRCDCFCEERLKQQKEDQDHLPLKKGDWICEKCNFLNFAKNTRCLQCKEKPTKRLLNPGEWECDSCSYINFRRNIVCLKCDHRRSKASNASNKFTQNQAEYVNYPSHDHERFLNKNEADGQRRNAAGMRRSVEKGEEDQSVSLAGDSKFLDFPVAGGKSNLSKTVYRKEIVKHEMSERNKIGARTEVSNDECEHADTQRKSKFVECTDDEDLSDWFGHERKMETSNLVSGP
ncbi:hypothetical protein K2173_012696 [Erythroxylum novogranatense]|uniref:RanBP2-type domain-containing protein n=1 Tax=Erythroxylum novogranatense TaxID=1862640 RepID=A0AAV8TW19_9ROSI|nr:hypothetical protein K2173_012696 [Erythroxylum novogranatense]